MLIPRILNLNLISRIIPSDADARPVLCWLQICIERDGGIMRFPILIVIASILVGHFACQRMKSENKDLTEQEIRQFIELKYPKSKRFQRALMDFAVPLIRIANGDIDHEKNSSEADKAAGCADAISPTEGNYVVALEERIFDTWTRVRRYAKYNGYFSGKILVIKDNGIKGCKFNLDDYEN